MKGNDAIMSNEEKMFNENGEFIKCGVLNLMNQVIPIFCIPDTGEVVFQNDLDGSCSYVAETSLPNPVQIPDEVQLSNSIKEGAYGAAIGVIFCSDYVVVIVDEDTAEKRKYGHLFEKGESYKTNFDQEYEL